MKKTRNLQIRSPLKAIKIKRLMASLKSVIIWLADAGIRLMSAAKENSAKLNKQRIKQEICFRSVKIVRKITLQL